ncbi:hypothetical protein Pelo_11935 [Pelomyxa schiedti]|nr:hypothetical protein Pelo_11935 [Pelomyxa schiedti]
MVALLAPTAAAAAAASVRHERGAAVPWAPVVPLPAGRHPRVFPPVAAVPAPDPTSLAHHLLLVSSMHICTLHLPHSNPLPHSTKGSVFPDVFLKLNQINILSVEMKRETLEEGRADLKAKSTFFPIWNRVWFHLGIAANKDFTQIVIASINMVHIASYLHKTHMMKTETID